MSRRLLLCLLTLLPGCERAPLPLDLSGERLMVHSMLLAQGDMVHVLVERVRTTAAADPQFPGEAVEILPVTGADVRITVNGQTIQLTEAPADLPPCASAFPYAVPQPEPIGPGCYAALVPAGVNPGEHYQLQVRLGGEVIATGEAVVPGLPVLTSPPAGARYEVVMGPVFDDRPLPGVLIRYELPPEIAGVRTSMRFDSIFVEGERAPQVTCAFDQFGIPPSRTEASLDSSVFIPRSLHCFRARSDGGTELIVPDSIFAQVALSAFDATYMAYDEAARQQSAELASLQAGIEGALGLFAGASITRRPVVLIPTETGGG